MIRVSLSAPRHIHPFNEPARDLRIQNKPLWLIQRDLISPYVNGEKALESDDALSKSRETMIVYRDNLWFDKGYHYRMGNGMVIQQGRTGESDVYQIGSNGTKISDHDIQ